MAPTQRRKALNPSVTHDVPMAVVALMQRQEHED